MQIMCVNVERIVGEGGIYTAHDEIMSSIKWSFYTARNRVDMIVSGILW